MSDDTNTNYYATLPPATRTKLEAGAFASLCSHLRDRSDAVQNIDLMALSGFCRNCLAKWLVLEARKMSAELLLQQQDNHTNSNNSSNLIQALDALGYDETAEHVYGCTYPEWKKRHATKATDKIIKTDETILDPHLNIVHILKKAGRQLTHFHVPLIIAPISAHITIVPQMPSSVHWLAVRTGDLDERVCMLLLAELLVLLEQVGHDLVPQCRRNEWSQVRHRCVVAV